MERLPKPLVALIYSIIDEYEQLTWNSHYLGDKMRISWVLTRGDLIHVRRGVKHKSRSNRERERDNKRMKTWKERAENTNNDVDKIIKVNSDNHDNSEVIMDSGDELQHDGQIDFPLEAPEQMYITPVMKVVQPVVMEVVQPVVIKIVQPYSVSLDRTNKDNEITERIMCNGSRNKKNVYTEVGNIENKEKDEIKTVDPKLIITGNNLSTDSHYHKIVFDRRSDGSCIIGKVKNRDTVVMCSIAKREIRHVNLDTEKSDFESAMHCVIRFNDVRKWDTCDIDCYVRHIPRMEIYAGVSMNKQFRWTTIYVYMRKNILNNFCDESKFWSGNQPFLCITWLRM
ncbi:Hypothetical predicted protein [Mytilus galloprovincialis]|uniref:Uncharacterized protein n=1 Tax=Mytilus galloprovincialis TaxID=29158 RepID=A0A8B6HT12_MYTGA|nr:Hypothetical predicted protein [Mytilus galloprovincialis]